MIQSLSATPLLSRNKVSVFFDGTFSTPKLSHPECVAIGPDGWVWVGNQDGDICRISPDARQFEKIASTGGFTLGLAFEHDRALYACDMKHAAVFRLDLASRTITRFTPPGIRIPNYPLVDYEHNRLLVSDSFGSGQIGPGIWSYDLSDGGGQLWYDQPMNFANGLAMRSGEPALYVCETFARRITRIAIEADGRAGKTSAFATDLPGLPDGIAFDRLGNLVVGLYEPSSLLRLSPDGQRVEPLVHDETAHLLCHPTNVAFDETHLFTANLGRWHVSKVEMDIGAVPLWKQRYV